MARATLAKKSPVRKTPTTPPRSERTLRIALAVFAAGVLAMAWMSMVSFDPTDPPSTAVYPANDPVHNQVGIVGAYLSHGLRYTIGAAGSYITLAGFSLFVVVSLTGRPVNDLIWRLVGLLLLIAAVSCGAYLNNPTLDVTIVEHGGGLVGMTIGEFFVAKFGQSGSWLGVLCGAGVGLVLAADEWLKKIFVGGTRFVIARSAAVRAYLAGRQEARQARDAEHRAKQQAKDAKHDAKIAAKEARQQKAAAKAAEKAAAKEAQAAEKEAQAAEKQAARAVNPKLADRLPLETLAPVAAPAAIENPAELPLAAALAASGGEATPAKPRKRKRHSMLPSKTLLATPQGGYSEVAEVQAAQRKLVLQQTFDDFNVQAKVEKYMTGPVITLFEVSLAPGVKVAQVANLAMDIARALAVPGVRIVPPRFGLETIGIEVPNLDKETVRILELMKMTPDAATKMILPMYLGKDAGGDAITVDLAKCPHMLIAGTTGSGKSVCINTIIMSLLMHRTPADVRFILVDPKMVEMAAYENLPHLLCPTINDMRKAEDILEWAVIKMDERYNTLKTARVKDLKEYNKLSPETLYERFGAEDEEAQARVKLKIPSLVIIIDELADLMMTSSKEVEGYIIRIAQKARAVGIHLVLATQRPSANVVTGLIKSNMPCRVSFRVASGQESRIVLDSKGAEVLLGQGDMLLLQPGSSTLVRAQGTFVDDSEIYKIVDELSGGQEPEFDAELIQLQSGLGPGALASDKDDLFDQAVEVVLSTKRGSVSLLQRRMAIGYGRASRIIDQMAEAGILGEHKGSQARECMIDMADWEAMKSGIAADQSGRNSYDGQGTSS